MPIARLIRRGVCIAILAVPVAAVAQTSQPASAPPRGPTGTAPRDAPGSADSQPTTESSDRRGRFGQQKLQLSYEPGITFRQRAGENGRLGSFQHDLRLSAPLYQDDRHEWLLLSRVKLLDFSGSARIPDGRWYNRRRTVAFPDHLWDVELGTSYRHRFDGGVIAGIELTIGSPSDKPFDSSDEVSLGITGTLRVPAGDDDAWLFFVNFDTARDFAPYVPLPGVGYEFSREKRLSGIVGFPFSRAQYRALDWLVLRGEYIFPHTIDAEIAVPIDKWELFAGYHWRNEQYLWSERRHDDDRLNYYEQAVKTGVRSPAFLDGLARFEIEAGFAFQRQYFVGEEYTDRKYGRLGVGDGPYLKVLLRFEL
ncbi:MAG: hypothetical protein ACKVS9_08450 [Phycisphaerae bacterium]